ncbi:MAG TPA: YitT family protein [Paenibacillus sp.]|nr:YitT family protein [Paenibacillus sp.]
MNGIQLRTVWNTWLPIMLGTAIYAFGLYFFVIPNHLMEGGVTGVALLLFYGAAVPPSVSTLLLNIPLFVVGFRAFGKRQMVSTIVGVLSLAFFLRVMEVLIARGWLVPFSNSDDIFLSVVYAGVTTGAGLGIVFRFGGTTGGIDIVARIVQRARGWSMGLFILLSDALIISAALLYIPRERILYTLVVVFIAAKMIDLISEGVNGAKAFMIIGSSGEKLAGEINRQLERGATIFSAKGAYSSESRDVVYCVVARHEAARLKAIVRSVDPRAFTIIGNIHDVLGEGFRPG